MDFFFKKDKSDAAKPAPAPAPVPSPGSALTSFFGWKDKGAGTTPKEDPNTATATAHPIIVGNHNDADDNSASSEHTPTYMSARQKVEMKLNVSPGGTCIKPDVLNDTGAGGLLDHTDIQNNNNREDLRVRAALGDELINSADGERKNDDSSTQTNENGSAKIGEPSSCEDGCQSSFDELSEGGDTQTNEKGSAKIGEPSCEDGYQSSFDELSEGGEPSCEDGYETSFDELSEDGSNDDLIVGFGEHRTRARSTDIASEVVYVNEEPSNEPSNRNYDDDYDKAEDLQESIDEIYAESDSSASINGDLSTCSGIEQNTNSGSILDYVDSIPPFEADNSFVPSAEGVSTDNSKDGARNQGCNNFNSEGNGERSFSETKVNGATSAIDGNRTDTVNQNVVEEDSDRMDDIKDDPRLHGHDGDDCENDETTLNVNTATVLNEKRQSIEHPVVGEDNDIETAGLYPREIGVSPSEELVSELLEWSMVDEDEDEDEAFSHDHGHDPVYTRSSDEPCIDLDAVDTDENQSTRSKDHSVMKEGNSTVGEVLSGAEDLLSPAGLDQSQTIRAEILAVDSAEDNATGTPSPPIDTEEMHNDKRVRTIRIVKTLSEIDSDDEEVSSADANGTTDGRTEEGGGELSVTVEDKSGAAMKRNQNKVDNSEESNTPDPAAKPSNPFAGGGIAATAAAAAMKRNQTKPTVDNSDEYDTPDPAAKPANPFAGGGIAAAAAAAAMKRNLIKPTSDNSGESDTPGPAAKPSNPFAGGGIAAAAAAAAMKRNQTKPTVDNSDDTDKIGRASCRERV